MPQSLLSSFSIAKLLLKAGYKNVWTPHARLYHHESASRGKEDISEKQVGTLSYMFNNKLKGEPITKIDRPLEKYLVEHSIKTAKESDFRGMQFNAIAESNKPALHTYKSLGFKEVGMIPQGFRLKDGSYSNMYIVLYLSLL